MRLLERSHDGWVFQVSRREKELLLTILRLYPRIPAGHHKLTRLAEPEASSQSLLDEALAEQRDEHQRRVLRLVSDPAKWIQSEHGWRLVLAEADMEWLLQVLNDIRVGSWVRLGSPEQDLYALTEKTAPDVWAMEVSGALQIALLQALGLLRDNALGAQSHLRPRGTGERQSGDQLCHDGGPPGAR